MGWVTLHSVATCYPESPTPAEQQLMASWLDMFRDTITCSHCRDHFATMLSTYRASFPDMLRSRHTFTVFTFRAHNAVNRRLRKPMQLTVAECMSTLQAIVKTRSATDYRVSYLNHIARYWRTFQDISGIVALKKIAELRTIETTYVQPRESQFAVTLAPDVVVLPRDALEAREDGPTLQRAVLTSPRGHIRFTAGGFRIQR
jgi:hypothetical protein